MGNCYNLIYMSGLFGLSSSHSHIINFQRPQQHFYNLRHCSRGLWRVRCPRTLPSTGKVHELNLPANRLEVTSNLLARVLTAPSAADWAQHDISTSLLYLKLSCARCLTLNCRPDIFSASHNEIKKLNSCFLDNFCTSSCTELNKIRKWLRCSYYVTDGVSTCT